MATVDKNYLYSIGRVRELEKGLLVETNLDRVLEADEPLSVLRSIGFFKTGDDHERSECLDDIFLRERQYNRKQLHELVADSPLEDIFLLPYDIENIKLFLKGKLTGNDSVKDIPVEEGKFRKVELLEAIYESLPTDIPSDIMDDIKELSEEFQATRRFSPIDCRLHRRLRLLQLDIARQAKCSFMVEYLQRLSDVQNISTMFRRKFHGLGRESLSEALLDTGTLAISFFERVYDSGWESLASAFKPTPYDKIVTTAVTEVSQDTFLPILDVVCANDMLDFLQNAKRVSFGIEPVIAFYLARENELKVVRTILAGKRFDYSQEKLQRRMRELYA
jgi:V/A-type H+-transporting ATPase subunit C